MASQDGAGQGEKGAARIVCAYRPCTSKHSGIAPKHSCHKRCLSGRGSQLVLPSADAAELTARPHTSDRPTCSKFSGCPRRGPVQQRAIRTVPSLLEQSHAVPAACSPCAGRRLPSMSRVAGINGVSHAKSSGTQPMGQLPVGRPASIRQQCRARGASHRQDRQRGHPQRHQYNS